MPNTERAVPEGQANQVEVQPEQRVLEKFFEGPWNSMVKAARWPIIAVFIAWAIFASIKASQIGPLTKQEEFLPPEHPISVAVKTLQDQFDGGGNAEMMIDIFWGINELNTEGGSRWDPEFIGTAVMDNTFDLSPPEAQASILFFCQDLRKQEFVKNQNVECWIEYFAQWV